MSYLTVVYQINDPAAFERRRAELEQSMKEDPATCRYSVVGMTDSDELRRLELIRLLMEKVGVEVEIFELSAIMSASNFENKTLSEVIE